MGTSFFLVGFLVIQYGQMQHKSVFANVGQNVLCAMMASYTKTQPNTCCTFHHQICNRILFHGFHIFARLLSATASYFTALWQFIKCLFCHLLLKNPYDFLVKLDVDFSLVFLVSFQEIADFSLVSSKFLSCLQYAASHKNLLFWVCKHCEIFQKHTRLERLVNSKEIFHCAESSQGKKQGSRKV